MLWIVSVIGTRPGQRGIPDVPNAAAVLTSKVSAEGGSVGRRVLASRHNEPSNRSLEISQVCLKFAKDNNIYDGDENSGKRNNELHEFINEQELSWSIKLRNDSLYVELPQLNEESKENLSAFSNLLMKHYIANMLLSILTKHVLTVQLWLKHLCFSVFIFSHLTIY